MLKRRLRVLIENWALFFTIPMIKIIRVNIRISCSLVTIKIGHKIELKRNKIYVPEPCSV